MAAWRLFPVGAESKEKATSFIFHDGGAMVKAG